MDRMSNAWGLDSIFRHQLLSAFMAVFALLLFFSRIAACLAWTCVSLQTLFFVRPLHTLQWWCWLTGLKVVCRSSNYPKCRWETICCRKMNETVWCRELDRLIDHFCLCVAKRFYFTSSTVCHSPAKNGPTFWLVPGEARVHFWRNHGLSGWS